MTARRFNHDLALDLWKCGFKSKRIARALGAGAASSVTDMIRRKRRVGDQRAIYRGRGYREPTQLARLG